LVVVALVEVALTVVSEVIVEDAVESKPPLKVRRVEVALLGKG
jgi:hypothetical protein